MIEKSAQLCANIIAHHRGVFDVCVCVLLTVCAQCIPRPQLIGTLIRMFSLMWTARRTFESLYGAWSLFNQFHCKRAATVLLTVLMFRCVKDFVRLAILVEVMCYACTVWLAKFATGGQLRQKLNLNGKQNKTTTTNEQNQQQEMKTIENNNRMRYTNRAT